MFINIDHEKRPSDYKLHLAKPNKEIISVLHEKQNSALNLKLGNISELNFSIPYFVEDSNLQMIKNPNIERIRELMYVKLTWGEFEEWFLIDNITESSEDNEIMNIQAFSIGYENKRKKINEFKETAINATEFYTEILKDSPWSIGEIDGSFDLLYRSFDESGTDRFELIKTGAETFGGVIVWDTNNKKINLKEPDNIGEFRGLTVSYDRLMSSLNKTRTTDEMVTRLYVYGNERITIENKNPTNEKYIEDYSYFMHPFKRDANKNVLESSYYMSDSLCHALLDNKELRDEYEPQIKTIQGNIENKNASLSLAMIELNDAEFTLMSAKGLLDIAKAVNDKVLIEQRKTEVVNATSIVNTKKTAVNNLTSQIENLQNQVSVLQNAISVRSFTKELIDELEPYIIEKEIEDARYIDEDELYEFAKEKFSEIREPRVVIETGIEGLMNSVEEQYYWDKLVLGDTMRVRQKRMNIDYKSRIIEMNIGLDDSDVEVKIANFTENVDNLDKFISILYSSESNSTILSNNKHKWDSVVEMRDQVTQLRESEIDATKKRITAGVNESVEIGERGIVITTPSFPNEMIIMQAGVIALSEDGGETWKTSVTPNGVVAETVIGKLIAGNNLIITNDSGSIVMDGDGLEIESDSIKIMSGGENPKNLIDDWNNMIINMEDFANDGTVTPYEKSQISHQWNMISDSHSKIIESFIKNMGVETPENPYPHEYDDYLIAYENLKEYLFIINQSDGYTLLNPNRMDIASPIDIGTYRLLVRSFTSTKDNFILVMPMEYANAYMEVLESSISLNYVKNDEVVAKINLSEEGTRIDGKLLEINSRTEFNDDLVMNAGLIQDANGDITIDLNKGEINLSKPLTINYIPIATKDDVKNIEMAYIASLSNDTALVPTDASGDNGDYSSAFTSIHIYQRDIDVTLQGWTFSATPSIGVNGLLSGNDFTVTSMSVESGYVDVSAIKGSIVLTKRFSISKARKGETGGTGQSAKIIRLSVDKEVMTFNNDDTSNPTNQTINIEAFIQGMTGNPTFTATAYNGNVSLGNVTTGFSGTGLKRTLSSSSFTANTTHITVTATLSGVTDKISIVKIKNGAQGDSGISPVVGYLTNEAIVLPANSEGIVSNYEMSEGYFRVFEGITDVSNQADYSELPSDNITINLNTSTGRYIVVDMEKEQSEGFVDIKATFKGVEIVKRVSVSKSKQGIQGPEGKDGYTPVKGADYFDGKDGNDGTSSYLWVMYSQNANGNPMVDSPTNAKYIGVATTTKNTKPTAYSDYKWSLVKGTDGTPGEPGIDGKTSYLHIKYSNDGTTFTSNNGETEGKWIGIYVDFVEADSNKFSDYTWNKVVGEDGEDAKLLYLSASAEAMTFNANNTPNPTTQTISFTANLQNTTGTATFTAIPYNGTTAMTAITLGGSGNTRTLTQSQFPATATKIEIKAVLGGLVDTVSVMKLKNGSDGENSVVGYLTNESISIPTNSSGAFTPANLAKATGTFRVFDGLTEKTTDTSVVFSTSTKVGLNGDITADGIYTVTALIADVATLELKATYKGVTIYKTLTVVKSRAGADGVSITRIFNEYAVNNSPAIAPTTGWDEVAPSRTSGEYLWVREKVNYSNSSSEITGTRMVTGDKGDIGLDGKNALSVMLLNESQSVATTSGRKATDTQIIKIPFTAFVGTTRTSCTASVGTLPSGVTLGSITNGTSSTDGVITLNVAKDATLGGTTSQFDTGSIEITITANDIGVKKFFNWTKSVSGVNGTTARTFFTESDVSVIVKKEDGSYTPSSFTFYSYYKDGTTANKTAYARFWKIETTVDGGNWTTYETKVDTESTTYTITSIPQNIVGIRATTYSTNALTSAHDTQSVMVVTDGESGISITNVIAEYSVNSSKVTEPTTGWQETQPNRPAGSFIWRRDRILYSDDSVTITKPVVMTGDKGDSGENAKLLYLSSNLESMIFNSDNTPNPSNQIATIEAKLQNVSGTVVYSATAYNGATSIGNVVLGGTGNVKTLSVNNFPVNASHISVTATLGSLTDTISIFKIRHGEKGLDGTDGTDGKNAIVGILTNESITVPASENGAVTSFAGATGTFEIYDGITRKTGSGVAYSVSGTPSNITVSINATTGVYTVSAMTGGTSVLSGNATLQAVYNGVTIQKVLTVTKAMTGKTGATGSTGASGSNAKIVTLTSSAQIFAKNADGVVSPANITVEGASQNTSIATWEYSVDGGTFSSTLPTGLSRTGNVVSITGSSVTAKSISLRAKDASGVSDVLSIAVVQDGAKGLDGSNGTNGSDAYTVVLSNEAHTFAGNTASAIASSVTVNVVAYKGATRVGATIGTISGAVEGMSTSIATNGTTTASFTVSVTTAMSTTNGILTIPITVDGKLFSKTFSFALTLRGADGANGSAGANAKVIIVNPSAQIFTKDANGNVTPSTITIDGTAQNVTISTWEYSIDGGAFSTSLPAGLTRSGNKVTITGSGMTAKNISVRASGSGVSDTTTIAMVQDGARGSDGSTGAKGDNSIVGYLTNESVTLGASSTGVVSSFATASGTFRVFDGITEVTTNSACVFSLNSSTGVTLTINSSGVYAVTAMSADTATAEFKAVYKGVTITKSMSLSKSRAGATGGQGAKGSDGISPIVGFLTNESITLPASSAGVVPSFTGATGTLNVYQGTVLKNAQADYSVLSQSNITVSITTAGVYTVSAMTTGASVLSGTATLRAEYGGVTIDKILTVTKALAGTQGATGSTGATGSAGQNATTYWINASTNAIKKDVSGTIVPNTITFSGFSKTGTSNPVAYAGRFIIQTSTDGVSYTTAYTSSANQASYTYTVPTTASFVKARYYLAGGTSTLLDEQTIPVLIDAEGIDKKYEGQSLLDKTEILSGTEIYTDKADDSVVHVEVDGKSVGGGSGKNLMKRFTDVTVVAPDNQAWIFDTLRFDTLTVGKRYVFSANVEVLKGTLTNGSNISVLARKSDGSSALSDFVGTTIQNGRIVGSMVANADIDRIYLYAGTAGYTSGNTIKFTNIQLEQKDSGGATPFEERVPEPDYPIAIHSLNDFDVVSSVGRRNYQPSISTGYRLGHVKESDLTVIDENTIEVLYPEAPGTAYIFLPTIAIRDLDEEYTISVLIENLSNQNVTMIIGLRNSGLGDATGVKIPIGESRIIKYSGIITSTGGSLIIFTGSKNVKMRISQAKVEKGKELTPWTKHYENFKPETYTPTLYKTNILLSEPLRSVGGVKDRLFRDDDGLWKIERNIAISKLIGNENWELRGTNASGESIFSLSQGVPNAKIAYDISAMSSHFKFWGGIGGIADTLQQSGEFFAIVASGTTRTLYFSIRTAKTLAELKAFLQAKNVDVLYELATPTIEILPQADQDKLNNITSYKDSNYVYTIVDKTNILPEYVQDNLKPTLHATFKGGGWYARFKTEQEFIKSQEQIGNKADKETVYDISSGIENLQKQILKYATKNEVSIDMAEYQAKLVEIQQSAKSGLEKAGDVEKAVNAVTNQMGVLAESWVFTNNYIKFAETSDLANISSDAKTKYPDIAVGAMLISNNNGSSKMLLTNNSLFFISNNEVVTAITDSYMNVDRAIFVSSAQIGSHKWSPSTTNEGHFLLEYVKPS